MIWDVVPGCKMIITIPHATKPNVWHDIQWFNSREAFNQHIDMSNTELMTKVKSWVGKYDMSHPFTGDVFGDWHEMAVQATGGFGAKFNFGEQMSGFIRSDAAETAKGHIPLLFYSRVKVTAGK